MTKRRMELLRTVRKALEEFDLRYPTEAFCLDVLFDWLSSGEQFLCVACGAEPNKRNPGSRSLHCSACNKTTWFTAGTFFHKTKKVRERFAVKWLMEMGVVFNSSILKDVLDLAGSTAWEIFHEISSLLADRMKHDQFPVLSSAHFREVVSKRSNLSIAAEHPRAELDELSSRMGESGGESIVIKDGNSHSSINFGECESCVDELSIEKPEDDELPDHELPHKSSQNTTLLLANEEAESRSAEVFALLRSGPCRFDRILLETGLEYKELCTILCLLEISGQIEKGFGDVYSVLNQNAPDAGHLGAQELSAIRRFTKWVKEHFGGISLKYLQNYIAYAWYVWDTKRFGEGELLRNLLLSETKRICKEKRQSPAFVEVFLGEPLTASGAI